MHTAHPGHGMCCETGEPCEHHAKFSSTPEAPRCTTPFLGKAHARLGQRESRRAQVGLGTKGCGCSLGCVHTTRGEHCPPEHLHPCEGDVTALGLSLVFLTTRFLKNWHPCALEVSIPSRAVKNQDKRQELAGCLWTFRSQISHPGAALSCSASDPAPC